MCKINLSSVGKQSLMSERARRKKKQQVIQPFAYGAKSEFIGQRRKEIGQEKEMK